MGRKYPDSKKSVLPVLSPLSITITHIQKICKTFIVFISGKVFLQALVSGAAVILETVLTEKFRSLTIQDRDASALS